MIHAALKSPLLPATSSGASNFPRRPNRPKDPAQTRQGRVEAMMRNPGQAQDESVDAAIPRWGRIVGP